MTTNNVLNSPQPFALNKGGTNASLTASNGGIVYSTATALAILSGTATAGQLLQSGSSAAPVWTTSTYPATNAINTLLYASAANVMSALATANNGVLITSAGGVPSISSTLPSNISATTMKLTTPWITTSLLDTNGNTWIEQTAIASAVNYVNIANQAAGIPPSLNAKGSDSNIALVINGKGTSGVPIFGFSDASNASAGYVGELISSVIASASSVTLTNNTPADITSISLTAGDWDVWGNAVQTNNTGTNSYMSAWISTTSASQPDVSLCAQVGYSHTGNNNGFPVPQQRISISSTTTVYLSIQAGFTAAMKACGGIYARRRR